MTTLQTQTEEHIQQNRSHELFQAIWRWHFYAGLIFAPFLVMLAVTGGLYLFKAQIESWMYKDLYQVQAEGKALPPSVQIEKVKKAYPDAQVIRYNPPVKANRSSEVGIQNGDQSLTVFVNPYSGTIIGVLNDNDRFMDRIEKLHGELMVGTLGDRLVELAACWAMILLITGILASGPQKHIWHPSPPTVWGKPNFLAGSSCGSGLLVVFGDCFFDHDGFALVRFLGRVCAKMGD